jgi:hypothetical protein
MVAGDETPEAKLQKLHLARQKGTEIYIPSASEADSILTHPFFHAV